MKNSCCSCHKPKANYKCGLCEEDVCKACAQFMDESTFSFLKSIPPELAHSIYCPRCFDAKVSSPLAQYEETMEKAKEVVIFLKNQSKQTRLFNRKEAPYTVTDCADKDETILRLAFFAAQDNFNSIIDIDLTSYKIIHGSHKCLKWNGTAIPCQLEERILKQDYYE